MKGPNIPGNVRRVVSTGHNIRGVKNNKENEPVAFESRHGEEVTTFLFHRNPEIINYWSQAERFIWEEEGKEHSYVPDYKVLYKDGRIEIWEITSRKRLKDEGNLRRIKAAKRICEERGWIYVLVFIEDLPKGTEEANLDALYSYRAKVYFNEAISTISTQLLQTNGVMRFFDLVEEIGKKLALPERHIKGSLLHLIWWDKIHVDLKRDLILLRGNINSAVLVSLSK